MLCTIKSNTSVSSDIDLNVTSWSDSENGNFISSTQMKKPVTLNLPHENMDNWCTTFNDLAIRDIRNPCMTEQSATVRSSDSFHSYINNQTLSQFSQGTVNTQSQSHSLVTSTPIPTPPPPPIVGSLLSEKQKIDRMLSLMESNSNEITERGVYVLQNISAS